MTTLLRWRTPRLTEPRTVLVNRRAADVLACSGQVTVTVKERP